MTSEQWRTQGVSKPLMRSLARSGDLVRLRRGVYATKSAVKWAETDPVRRHALDLLAVLPVVGRHAVASFHSAAILHRVDLLKPPPEGTVNLTLPPARPWNRARPAGLAFHSAELPGEHVTRLYNLPVTTAARTVADLARTLPFTDAVVVADSALHQEKATKADLGRVLGACIERIRRAIAAAQPY